MAFCPECGKQAAADAANCASCGYAFAIAEKKAAAAARFKGTMMMAAPATAEPTTPANGNAAPPARAAPAVVVAAGNAGKRNGKATMMGQGIGPVVVVNPVEHTVGDASAPRATHQGQPAGYAAAQPHAAAATVQAFAATPAQGFVPRAEPAARSASAARYLPGDPMAPQPVAAARSAPRLHLQEETSTRVYQDRKWLYWAVCGMVLVSVVVLAIGLF
jgi:hypothetical protein